MGITSIEWTATVSANGTVIPGYTYNPWRGCTKVSDGCKFCYAETLSARNPAVLGSWGPKGQRVIAAESYWKQPVKWNKAAAEEPFVCRNCGTRYYCDSGSSGACDWKCEIVPYRPRVFCASLADVFEGPETMPHESWPAVSAARLRLFRLIFDTPHLDWLLLTKRPENWLLVVAGAMNLAYGVPVVESPFAVWLEHWVMGQPPANVWIGTSVEDQATADERIPHLLKIPAAVRFLSCEPLLGPVDLTNNQVGPNGERGDFGPKKGFLPLWWHEGDATVPMRCGLTKQVIGMTTFKHGWQRWSGYCGISWVICGGESGPNARPMHPEWARSLRDQCAAAGVPFHFKQHGEWVPYATMAGYKAGTCAPGSDETVGGDCGGPRGLTDFRKDRTCLATLQDGSKCRVRYLDVPEHRWGKNNLLISTYLRVGKKNAGRLLDGQIYNEFPIVEEVA